MDPAVQREHKHRNKDRSSGAKSDRSKPNIINMPNQSSKIKFIFKEVFMADKENNFTFDEKSSNNPLRSKLIFFSVI